MKISLNWLTTLLPVEKTAEEISSLLTGCGLEVESLEEFESLPGGLKGLVVGEVLECEKHPDADRLRVTKVDIGDGTPLSIVCGAPNVAAGQKVVVATINTKLFPKNGEAFEIKKSKIRGQLSEGMICAEDEIGIGTDHDGIIVLPEDTKTGSAVADLYKVEHDLVFEIGLTPNRGDAASHLGVARDLAAVLNTIENGTQHRPKISGLYNFDELAQTSPLKIRVADHEACRRYSGIVIKDIQVKDSPQWLQNRLRSIGVRPINNIVDATNFVLHELGQPLHAFDLAKIKGNEVIVRRAGKAEKFVTLDGVERNLSEDDLMICDESSPLCIAGIFGGAESGVTATTTEIFLESAFFDSKSIRKSSRAHQLKTDASFRFERGTDPEMTVVALQRATDLILHIAGGRTASAVYDLYPDPLPPHRVAFSFRNCSDLIGKEIDRARMKNIILSLGITIDSEGSDGLLLFVPRYKHDVTREADVIEEVLRIYGYDNVEPAKTISYGIPSVQQHKGENLPERIADFLAATGFREMMGLSLSNADYYNSQETLAKVLNPLSSELGVLRADLLFSGLEAVAHNINRQQTDLKLFELGRIYRKNNEQYEEEKRISIFVTGAAFSENPHGLKREADQHYLNAALQSIFELSGVNRFQSDQLNNEQFVYGIEYSVKKRFLAHTGLVQPALLKKFDIRQKVFYASISLDELQKAAASFTTKFEEPARFPSVRRDLALLLDKSVKYSEVEELAFSTEKKLLSEVNLFDIYEDQKLGNKRSYAVRFTLLNREATLTDKQIDGVMDKLIKNYKEKLGAELR